MLQHQSLLLPPQLWVELCHNVPRSRKWYHAMIISENSLWHVRDDQVRMVWVLLYARENVRYQGDKHRWRKGVGALCLIVSTVRRISHRASHGHASFDRSTQFLLDKSILKSKCLKNRLRDCTNMCIFDHLCMCLIFASWTQIHHNATVPHAESHRTKATQAGCNKYSCESYCGLHCATPFLAGGWGLRIGPNPRPYCNLTPTPQPGWGLNPGWPASTHMPKATLGGSEFQIYLPSMVKSSTPLMYFLQYVTFVSW